MKAVEVTQKIIAGLVDSSVEIFAQGKGLFFSCGGKVNDISQLASDIRKTIEALMWENKPAVKILHNWCDNTNEMVDQYMFCNFGGLTIKPDYDSDNAKLSTEVWDCPLRGKCEGEGKICQSNNEARFTNKEIQVLQFVRDNKEMPFKAIAHHLNMAKNTLQQHTKSIYRKTGIHSKTEMVFKAMAINAL